MRYLIYLFFFVVACSPLLHSQTVFYTPSQEDIVNPDRGFYHPVPAAMGTSFNSLDVMNLVSKREEAYTPFQANYSVRTSLVFRYYVLNAFTGTDVIGAHYLSGIQADFNAAREAGVRMIIRFAYTITPNTSCGAAACPPYGDVPKSRVLAHIAQLKPLLQDNADVIAVVQAGFIGVWGENYYTDHFGDPSLNGDGRILDSNWVKRNEVLAAVLDAVPQDRMVQVRYPQLKQRFIYGIDAPVSAPAMTLAQAYQSTDIARIGFHNDCFLASPSDFGTYTDYGSSSSFPQDRIATFRAYFSADGQYTCIGGETCFDGYSPQNDCSGNALSDLETLHYSFLNSDYNNDVNNDWETSGCMDEIKHRLGYRFVLKDCTFPSSQAAATSLNFSFTVENTGFAAPFNYRMLQLVLRNSISGDITKLNVTGSQVDTRFWRPGSTATVDATVSLPNNLPEGNYELLLHILDPSGNFAVADRPEYSIQFANVGTWESHTGYNNLLHTLTVFSPFSDCTGEDLELVDTPSGIQTYRTSGKITSTQEIPLGADVTYEASTSIVLQPGFSVSNGATFSASIVECGVNGSQSIINTFPSTGLNEKSNPSSVEKVNFKVFPNPTSDASFVTFEMPEEGVVSLRILDWLGRSVFEPMVNEFLGQGQHQQQIILDGQPVGVYVVLLQIDGSSYVQQVVHVRKG